MLRRGDTGLPGDPLPGLGEALASFATGVTLVTVADGRDDIGTTVSAFCPVSWSPPLVLVSLIADSYPAEVLGRVDRFAVTVLRAGQRVLAGRFAVAGRPGARLLLDGTPHGRGELSGALIPERRAWRRWSARRCSACPPGITCWSSPRYCACPTSATPATRSSGSPAATRRSPDAVRAATPVAARERMPENGHAGASQPTARPARPTSEPRYDEDQDHSHDKPRRVAHAQVRHAAAHGAARPGLRTAPGGVTFVTCARHGNPVGPRAGDSSSRGSAGGCPSPSALGHPPVDRAVEYPVEKPLSRGTTRG